MGEELALAARWVLGAVFAWSGLRKLRSPGLASQLRRLRVPAPSAVGAGLPVFELLLGGLLVVAESPAAALVAIAVLVAFTAVVVANLAGGNAVPCPCFGAADRPISGATVARNGWFLALGVLATGSPGEVSNWGAALPAAVLGAITALVAHRTSQS